MTLADIEPRQSGLDEEGDGAEHLICGSCFPGYVEGRVVRALCGKEVPDQTPCPCTRTDGGCQLRCVERQTCPLCVLAVQMAGGCGAHGW